MAASGILAIGAAEFTIVLILLGVLVIPIAGIAFARSGRGYDEIGKGRFAVDFGEENETGEQEELRQLVQAKAYRQERRGEAPIDVEEEIDRLLGRGSGSSGPASGKDFGGPASGPDFGGPASGQDFGGPASGKDFGDPASGKDFGDPASGPDFGDPASGPDFGDPASGPERGPGEVAPVAGPETDQIRAEIRQVVIAGNERRERRGEAPLDVEAEIDRLLAEFQ